MNKEHLANTLTSDDIQQSMHCYIDGIEFSHVCVMFAAIIGLKVIGVVVCVWYN